MVISQGEIWWADFGPTAVGTGVSAAGSRRSRPAESELATVVCVALTSNLTWADAPGNVLLQARTTGLPKDSVVVVSQVVTVDKTALTDRVGKLPPAKLQLVLAGIDVVLGR